MTPHGLIKGDGERFSFWVEPEGKGYWTDDQDIDADISLAAEFDGEDWFMIRKRLDCPPLPESIRKLCKLKEW